MNLVKDICVGFCILILFLLPFALLWLFCRLLEFYPLAAVGLVVIFAAGVLGNAFRRELPDE